MTICNVIIYVHYLERYGWTVYVKDLPVSFEDIENKAYVERVCLFTPITMMWSNE